MPESFPDHPEKTKESGILKILSASYLLPISGDPIPEGAVVIDDGKIVEAGPNSKIRKKYPDAACEEFNNAVLMPGLVNADTHLELLSLEDGGREPNFIDCFFCATGTQAAPRPGGKAGELE